MNFIFHEIQLRIETCKFLFLSVLLFSGISFSGSLPDEIQYIHPLPDSRFHRWQTNVILRLEADCLEQ